MAEAARNSQISGDYNKGIIAGQDVYAEGSTHISESINHGYIAGRDLFLGDQYVVQETLFFEPDLKDVESPGWITPPKAQELAGILARNRLIVLAGHDLDDKTMVARHLACLLRRELCGVVKVREWYRSSDPQKIESAFHETATTILLLPQVLPHHIGHRLTELQGLLQTRRNYTIITTEGTRSEWGISSGSADEQLWQEISWETYYGRALLAETLRAELAADAGRLPDWVPSELQADSPLSEGLTLEETAARLKQPDRIRRFAQWLLSEEASPRGIAAQLDQLAGDREAIFRWYRQLDRTDQLLALGLVLFDGLPDDQIFAALELLVDEAWRRSDPNLPLFDYKDLERLSAYFHLAESGDDGTRIETSSSQKREAILQAAWELQRRRLLAVVPAMTRLLHAISPGGPRPEEPAIQAKASAKASPQAAPESDNLWRFTKGAERELFSSRRRAEQLQRSIIEALSRIGLLSFEAVEASFLELAAGTEGFQTIVAKALAAWRGEGHSKHLFNVLLAWWRDGSVATPTKSLVLRSKGNGEGPWAAVRATVALAVGYALQYDQPNQLAPELQSLLQELVHDRHPEVRARVLELTLPLAAASHLRQLEPLLRSQIVGDQDHLYAIAFGASMAFSIRPPESLEIVERWHDFCRAQILQEHGDLAGTPRDRLLSAVALSYGYVRHDQVHGILTPEQTVSRLRSILSTEVNPFVRTHALMAMGLQAVNDFDLVASTLMELISEITLPDRLHVVTVLVRAYLSQRERLEGGEEEIEAGGRTFQVWSRSPRPLTTIESSLYTWLQDMERPVVQQVAIQTFAGIAATELEQRERELGSRRAPAPAPPPPPMTRVHPNPPRLRQLSLLGRMAVFLAIPRQKENRARLLPVVAEVAEVRRTERSRVFENVAAAASRLSGQSPAAEVPALKKPILPVVLARWQTIEDSGMKSLAQALEGALAFFRWRWAILGAAVLSCVLLVHDYRDWRWALGSSITRDEARMIQQRRAVPLRLALNLGLPEMQRIWEIQKLEEVRRIAAERAEAAEQRAAEALRKPVAAPVAQVVQVAQRDVVPEKPQEAAPEPVVTPMDRLRNSAMSMLARLPESDLLWILRELRYRQREEAALQAEAASEARAEPQETAEAPQPAVVRKAEKVREVKAEATPQAQAAVRQEEPEPAPAVAAVEQSPAQEQLHLEPSRDAAPAQETGQKQSLWQKIRKRLPKKKGKGDGDGSR